MRKTVFVQQKKFWNFVFGEEKSDNTENCRLETKRRNRLHHFVFFPRSKFHNCDRIEDGLQANAATKQNWNCPTFVGLNCELISSKCSFKNSHWQLQNLPQSSIYFTNESNMICWFRIQLILPVNQAYHCHVLYTQLIRTAEFFL